jgi:transcriptional repressor NrdR
VRCPYCSDEANRVIDSRLGRDGAEIRRRRECIECGRRFTTRERVEEIYPKICKRDERREDYERQKLVLGIQKACEKRAVSADAIELLADRVERHLQSGREESDLTSAPRVMESSSGSTGRANTSPRCSAASGHRRYTAFFAGLGRGARRHAG